MWQKYGSTEQDILNLKPRVLFLDKILRNQDTMVLTGQENGLFLTAFHYFSSNYLLSNYLFYTSFSLCKGVIWEAE
jgi:hypothetical protein